MRPALLLLCLLACAAPQRVAMVREEPAPRVQLDPSIHAVVDVEHYLVSGKSAREVRRQMDERGPEGKDRRYDAKTSWSVRWSYDYAPRDGRCRVTRADVTLKIHYLLPQLDGAPASVEDPWHSYEERLLVHEDGHADIARKAANATLEALKELPPTPRCDELKAQIERTASETVRRYNAADDAYDAETGHGRTQGATFP